MENKVCKVLGINIKNIRKSRGLTQNKLAELINLDVKSLSLIETGHGFASAKTLEKIQNVLNVELGDLFRTNNENKCNEIYSNITNNLELLKNNAQKLQTIDIVIKSLI